MCEVNMRRFCRKFLPILALLASPFAVGRLGVALSSSSSTSAATNDDNEEEASSLSSSLSSSSCPAHCHIDASAASQQGKEQEETAFRIFYLIILHNERTMNDAVQLFRAIRDPRNTILIHVDSKVKHLIGGRSNNNNYTLLEQEIQNCPCGSRVRIESVHDVQWSQWSMNLPTLWGMQVAVEEYNEEKWDVFINLAADTLPVYKPNAMAEILSQLPYNFVTSSSCETGLLPTNVYKFPEWWHKRSHYTNDDTEADPIIQYQTLDSDGRQLWQNQTLVTHFGSQWVILLPAFCRWIVEQLRNENSLASLYAKYLQSSQKLMTDETYLPTLLVHATEFEQSLPRTDAGGRLLWRNGSVSEIRDVRYERMDEHVPTAFGHFWTQQRYDVHNSSLADRPRPWGPYFLGVYDLANLRASGALFARKISKEVDHNLLNILPVDRKEEIPDIQWPKNEVLLTPKPNYDYYIQLAKEMAKKEREVHENDDAEEL